MESLSLKGRRSSNASQGPGAGEEPEGNANDTSQLDKEEGNVLMTIIGQLRPGMDLSKIALPTFVLEPRSLLERVTDFFSHPELVFGVGKQDNPQERFLRVMTYYLSGWHIKPRGVKKPYNPVLGEFFRCSYFYPDGSEGYYLAEQVSHHPPVSAFFYCSPQNNLLVTGELLPKSKFLGNSAATIMEGEDRIRLLDRPEDGEYCISMPNTYARGILFGKLILELCEMSSIVCAKNDLRADVDFKAKGWISGGYNAIGGPVRQGRSTLGDVTGHWSSVIDYTDNKSGKKRTLFDASASEATPKTVLPESEQEENESRRLWAKLTTAIKTGDMHGATAEKNVVEERQRELARKREAEGTGYKQRFFRSAGGNKWMPRLDIENLPKDPKEMERVVKEFIFGDKAPQKGDTASANTPTFRPQADVGGAAAPAPPSATTRTSVLATASTGTGGSAIVDSAASSASGVAPPSPPSAPTAPGAPAPGPKADHPIKPISQAP